MRIVMGIEYEGSQYRGWQRQLEVESVQEHLERSISQIAAEPIKLFCAGRTDAGVHAIGQVAHFDTMAVRAESSWIRGTNSNLPRTIKVGWARVIPETFHARFSALARHYRYIIDNGSTPPALLGNGVLYYPWPLEVELMHQAGQYLVGEHDFSAFRAVQCQSNSPWRNLMQLSVTRIGRYVTLDLKANAFVHHMVRNIVGVLLKVGSGKRSPSWVADLLASRDRTQGAETAKAHGLYLVKVDYPTTFNIPTDPAEHLFLINSTQLNIVPGRIKREK